MDDMQSAPPSRQEIAKKKAVESYKSEAAKWE